MKFLGVLSLFILSACSIVGPQERGIRLYSGAASGILDPGIHVWVPVLLGIDKIDVSVQKTDEKTSAASKDMQEVSAELAVNWTADSKRLLELYKQVGDDTEIYKRLISPAVSEVLKSAMSKKTAEEILSERLSLKQDIDDLLKSRLEKYGINVLDVSIVNLTFTADFAKAIEAKQIAEQQAKQASYLAQKATEDAKGRVNEAKGEAEAQRLLRTNLTAEMIRLKAIEKWDGQLPTYVGAGTPLPFLDIHK